jgi:RNA polymerase sigma-B factor
LPTQATLPTPIPLPTPRLCAGESRRLRASARRASAGTSGTAGLHSADATGLRDAKEENLGPLFEAWQRGGDRRAREILVERFQPLARSLARRYLGSSESIEDLTQVAYLGLIKAIDRFDASRDNRFASYAIPTILGEIRRHFRDTAWAVHVTRGAQEHTMEVQRARELLTSRRQHSPTVGEIAGYLECDQQDVLEAMQVSQARTSVSLDAPPPGGGGEDSEPSRVETFGEEDPGYELVEDGSVVMHAAASLAPRERHILHLRFAREMTQSEIATHMGLSQMQISRVLRHSLQRMRTIAEGSAGAG